MDKIIQWSSENWHIIAGAIAVLVQILQLISKHWSQHEGLKKAVTFAVEMLSIFTSLGAVNGKFGKLKLPLQSVRPK